MVERTAIKMYPVVKEVVRRMIEENHPSSEGAPVTGKAVGDIEFEKVFVPEEADMKTILGFLNQNEWIQNLNIGNIMQIQPINVKDLLQMSRNETELSRDSFLEKLSLLCVSYFCVSTEMRFLL
jgi:hypothetical protein